MIVDKKKIQIKYIFEEYCYVYAIIYLIKIGTFLCQNVQLWVIEDCWEHNHLKETEDTLRSIETVFS